MTPDLLSSDSVARFFTERKIDAFFVADCSGIHAPAGRHPHDILPVGRSLIIFGVMMPDPLFFGSEGEQAAATGHVRDVLESAAITLRDRFVAGGAFAEAVLPSFPLIVENGIIRGRLSLKHCASDAGFGTIGDNTLLIHPRFGNRLALAAVITSQEIAPTPRPAVMPACTHCGKCTAACTHGAVCDTGIIQTSCRNITGYVPRPLHPVAWRLMRGRYSARLVTWLLNLVAPYAVVRPACAACVTACPYFHKVQR